jgi:hypothetical protein
VIYLNQGWSKADRETYYHMSQGSEALSYDIFLNLEVADGQDLFRSDANTDRYGLIPQTPTPGTNPDGLPIGISKTVATNPRWKGEYIAITCAACHDSELTYKGKRIRIDGGAGNHFDFLGYVYALDDAMQATLTDSAKFDRLAARMGATSPDAKAALRQRYESEAQIVHVFRTRTLVTPGPWGPGRLDAIAGIVNRVTADKPGIPEKVDTSRTNEASICLEYSPEFMDPVARGATRPDRSQPDRGHGRPDADGSAFQDASGGPLRSERGTS